MSSGAMSESIKKLHVEATVNFAINHIPSVDEETLLRYLELVNVTGNFGSISKDQLVAKMGQVVRYIPDACEQSLYTLGDLLELPLPPKTAQAQSEPDHHHDKIVGMINPMPKRETMRSAAGWQH